MAPAPVPSTSSEIWFIRLSVHPTQPQPTPLNPSNTPLNPATLHSTLPKTLLQHAPRLMASSYTRLHSQFSASTSCAPSATRLNGQKALSSAQLRTHATAVTPAAGLRGALPWPQERDQPAGQAGRSPLPAGLIQEQLPKHIAARACMHAKTLHACSSLLHADAGVLRICI